MTLKELINMDGGEAIEWLIDNQWDYELIPVDEYEDFQEFMEKAGD